LILDRPTLQAIRDAALTPPIREQWNDTLPQAFARLAEAADAADALLARQSVRGAQDWQCEWPTGTYHGVGFNVEWKPNGVAVLKSPGIDGKTVTLSGTVAEEFFHLFQGAATEVRNHAVVLRYLHPYLGTVTTLFDRLDAAIDAAGIP
jgi:hypothetical protein